LSADFTLFGDAGTWFGSAWPSSERSSLA